LEKILVGGAALSVFRDLLSEFKAVFGRDNRILDVIAPPLVFLIANRIASLAWAVAGALLISALLLVFRVYRGQPLKYALGGLGSAGLAAGLSLLTNSPSGYFLPGLITGGLTVGVALISVLAKRPLAAWSSHITRSWTLQWYWHDRVRPAYSEVTWGWLLFFCVRFYLQFQTYLNGSVETLGVIQLISGWPALIIVLALSYMYGIWRLRGLQGPSVEEFEANVPPPWIGQQKGF